MARNRNNAWLGCLVLLIIGMYLGIALAGIFWPAIAEHFTPLTYTGHSQEVFALAWSPDGTRIASGSLDGTAQVWNAVDGRRVLTYYGHNGKAINALAWSPDGSLIATAGPGDSPDTGEVQIWRASDGSHVYTYHESQGSVEALAWSPDSQRLASTADGVVRSWNARDGSGLLTYHLAPADQPDASVFTSISWSHDGARLASTDGTAVEVWDARTTRVLFTYDEHTGWSDYYIPRFVAWSPDSRLLAVNGPDQYDCGQDSCPLTELRLLDARTGNDVKDFAGPDGAIAWSPDGKDIALCGGDGVTILDVRTGSSPFTFQGHSGTVDAVVWSPDGKQLASAGADGTARRWDTQIRPALYLGHAYLFSFIGVLMLILFALPIGYALPLVRASSRSPSDNVRDQLAWQGSITDPVEQKQAARDYRERTRASSWYRKAQVQGIIVACLCAGIGAALLIAMII